MDVKLLKELLNLDKTVQKSDKMQVPKKIEISKIILVYFGVMPLERYAGTIYTITDCLQILL